MNGSPGAAKKDFKILLHDFAIHFPSNLKMWASLVLLADKNINENLPKFTQIRSEKAGFPTPIKLSPCILIEAEPNSFYLIEEYYPHYPDTVSFST